MDYDTKIFPERRFWELQIPKMNNSLLFSTWQLFCKLSYNNSYESAGSWHVTWLKGTEFFVSMHVFYLCGPFAKFSFVSLTSTIHKENITHNEYCLAGSALRHKNV